MRTKLSEEHKKRIGDSNRGRTRSKEEREKMSLSRLGKHYSPETEFKKGSKAPNKGKTVTAMQGELHPQWKGEEVGYHALHAWLKRKFGKPDNCENMDCVYPRKNAAGKIIISPKRYHWANLSGEYLRDRSDYIQLCSSCHKKMDMGIVYITR